MNPFAWSGPKFLLFYLVLSLGVIAWCWARARYPGASIKIRSAELTSDPYRIAYLRGGRDEAIRIALFNLVDRGLLDFDGAHLIAAAGGGSDALKRPLDRQILNRCRHATTPDDVRADAGVRADAAKYEAELTQRGLMPGPEEKRARAQLAAGAFVVLAVVALIKLVVAFMAARSNVGFLIVLAIIASVAALLASFPRASRAGRQALSDVRGLLGRLKSNAHRLKSGGASNEALLLAAVAGLAALPAAAFPFAREMFPRPTSDSSGSSSDGGSSCSSSCGGGGGCGGCGG